MESSVPRSSTDTAAGQVAAARADRAYRLIVEAMNEGAATVSPQGVILDANPRLGSMSGQPATTLVGTAVLDLVPDAHRPTFARLLDVDAGDSARGEVGLKGPDGTTVPVLLAVGGLDLDGMFVRSLVLTDLTAQRATAAEAAAAVAAREAAQEQDAFLEQARECAGLGWWTYDPEREVMLAFSPQACRIFGLTPAQFDGKVKTLLSIVHPDAVSRITEAITVALAGGAPYQTEHKIVRPDGSVRWVLQAAVVQREETGVPRLMLGVCQDITDRKRIEDEIRTVAARLGAIFDNAPVGIDDLRLTGEFVRVNPQFSQITGYTADDLQSLTIQDIIHPDDREADRAGVQRLLSGAADSYSMEKRFVRKDGDVIWTEVNRALVRDRDGDPLLMVGVVRDITAQRLAEAEVRKLADELEARVEKRTSELQRSNSNLEAFTYSVSHDLRAPLRALHGFSEALQEEYGDRLDETGHGYLERIVAASERMAALIDDLLLLSRVSRADINLGPVNLSLEVASIADELQQKGDRRVRLCIQDDVWVSADRALIRSVVQNLIENAWKFTARRTDAVIEFGATTAEGAEICCYVRDNGVGFDSAYAGKLFQAFQRLHTDREFAGTGIGLASVRRIIERHGGRTWAEGAIDNGATFYFTLAGATPPRPG